MAGNEERAQPVDAKEATNSAETRPARLGRVRREVLRRINYLTHKAVIDYREVYHLIRDFFKEFLEKHYEFTITELRAELRQTYVPPGVRRDVFTLLDALEKMEYETVQYTKPQLVSVLELFRHTVTELVKSQQRKRTFWQKVKAFLLKEEEEPIIVAELPAIEDDDSLHVHLHMILERLYLFLNQRHAHKARRQYEELLELYERAPEPVQQEFYFEVQEAYQHLLELMQH